METIITLTVIALTLLPIIIGALLGWLRGWRRAALRFGLVILSIILAFAFRKVIGNAIASAKLIEGQTLSEYLMQMLQGSMSQGASGDVLANLQGIVDAIVKGIAYVLSFLLAFGILLLFTWAVVYPVCKIFVKPKLVEQPVQEDGKKSKPKYKKYGLIGAGIGAVQGLIVAVFCGIMITGIAVQGNNALGAIGMLQSSDSPNEALDTVSAMCQNYTDSSTCAFYNTGICQSIFNKTSEVKIEKDGTTQTKTLGGTVSALKTAAGMYQQALKLQDVDFGSLFDKNADASNKEEAKQKVQDVFNNLAEMQGSMSEEAKETVKEVLDGVIDGLGDQLGADLPLDLSSVDFSNVDFKKEGEVLGNLIEFASAPPTSVEESKEDIKKVVDEVVKSDLVYSVLEGSKDNINLQETFPEEELDKLAEVLDEVEDNVDEELKDRLDSLREMFGL